MLEVSPLSPLRECAISHSRMGLSPPRSSRLFGRRFRGSTPTPGDDLTRRPPGPSARCGAVGVKRLDLFADPPRLLEAVGAADNSNPHLIRIAVTRARLSVQRVNPDEAESRLSRVHAGECQTFADDVERQSCAGGGVRTGIGDLAFADIAVDLADRRLE